MAFKLNRSSKEPMSEINVTPFVDVMLVLLNYFYGYSSITNGWSTSRFTRKHQQTHFQKKLNHLLYQ